MGVKRTPVAAAISIWAKFTPLRAASRLLQQVTYLECLRGGLGHQADELRVGEVGLLGRDDALVQREEFPLGVLEEDEGMSVAPRFAAAAARLLLVGSAVILVAFLGISPR